MSSFQEDYDDQPGHSWDDRDEPHTTAGAGDSYPDGSSPNESQDEDLVTEQSWTILEEQSLTGGSVFRSSRVASRSVSSEDGTATGTGINVNDKVNKGNEKQNSFSAKMGRYHEGKLGKFVSGDAVLLPNDSRSPSSSPRSNSTIAHLINGLNVSPEVRDNEDGNHEDEEHFPAFSPASSSEDRNEHTANQNNLLIEDIEDAKHRAARSNAIVKEGLDYVYSTMLRSGVAIDASGGAKNSTSPSALVAGTMAKKRYHPTKTRHKSARNVLDNSQEQDLNAITTDESVSQEETSLQLTPKTPRSIKSGSPPEETTPATLITAAIALLAYCACASNSSLFSWLNLRPQWTVFVLEQCGWSTVSHVDSRLDWEKALDWLSTRGPYFFLLGSRGTTGGGAGGASGHGVQVGSTGVQAPVGPIFNYADLVKKFDSWGCL
ncbi:unnamed protein product [Amoebophrya sp. A120]|nr:unnamed protein product [Amoebophrya sp. A120]|eukprot:GSA120T00010532001.1